MIRPARMISDGCIWQHDKEVHIWGWTDSPGEIRLRVEREASGERLAEVHASISGENDRFDAYLPPMESGGPFSLVISQKTQHRNQDTETMTSYGGTGISVEIADTDTVIIHDIYVGEVIHLAGQSNIEFPMWRVQDTYPEEFENPDEPLIRTFKVQPNLVFTEPLKDAATGEWTPVTQESLRDFSAIGYFLAKALRERTGRAIGLVNTTLGGSFVGSWMSRQMLLPWQDQIEKLEDASRPNFVEDNYKENISLGVEWEKLLNRLDVGVKEKYKKPMFVCAETKHTVNDTMDHKSMNDDMKDAPSTSIAGWQDITLPAMFSQVPELKGFTGVVWFKKTFDVPKEMAGKRCMLWLGTMTDADDTFVNGKKVGSTPYKYPPRRYPIPKGLLVEGTNEVTIRLKIETGHGRVTPGKLLAVFNGEGRRVTDGFHEAIEDAATVKVESVDGTGNDIDGTCGRINWLTDLSGTWKMKKGCDAPQKVGAEFIIQRPAGCYNGMLAPCLPYTVGEVVWYQGESDSDKADQYMAKFKTLVESWREAAGKSCVVKTVEADVLLPFYVINLPEYNEMLYEKDENPATEHDWEKMQQVLRTARDLTAVYPVEIIGTGEWNDLHPQRKKPVAEKLADVILSKWQ